MTHPPISDISWIAVDWGTSRLRAWAMSADSSVLQFQSSDDGIRNLKSGAFEPALLSLINPWLGTDPIPVIACGMVGSRQGWVEAPYKAVPCAPIAAEYVIAGSKSDKIRAFVLPGLMQSDPPDVMRGEETQVAGFLSQNSTYQGVLCMPGTHTKWALIDGGKITEFHTFMTGDIFACLSEHSVLRHSINSDAWDPDVFLAALDASVSRPEALARSLFAIRSKYLLDGQEPGASRASLSGILMGTELAAAKKFWLGNKVTLIGDPKLAGIYSTALNYLGVQSEIVDADRMTLNGLALAHSLVSKLES